MPASGLRRRRQRSAADAAVETYGWYLSSPPPWLLRSPAVWGGAEADREVLVRRVLGRVFVPEFSLSPAAPSFTASERNAARRRRGFRERYVAFALAGESPVPPFPPRSPAGCYCIGEEKAMDRAVDGFGMTSVEGARDLRGRASSRDGGDACRDAEGTGGDCKAGGGEQRAPAGISKFIAEEQFAGF
ncbi:hypothetical protein C2845_PM16G13310 [Panicum miliaceum]|uniref:Uncharacterized protein n=1 Tax=Panicum miliaceum TaxID=4540 RepID=A0A3L6PUL6_PANMI|nr:hypothetical protein C2845_PM16G13310 [Panicum miliaceum]